MSNENAQKLVLVNPLNEPAAEQSRGLARRPSGLQGVRVGLLDNSKNKAGPLLDMVANILNERYGFSNIVRHRKPSSAKPVAPEVIAEWATTCDIAIAGVGD